MKLNDNLIHALGILGLDWVCFAPVVLSFHVLILSFLCTLCSDVVVGMFIMYG